MLRPLMLRPLMLRPLSLAALMLACAAPTGAADLPARKPGLWQLTMTFMSFEAAKLPPLAAEHCIDAATDKLMNLAGGSLRQDSCWKQDVQNVGGTVVVDSVCKTGPLTLTMHAVVSGDLNNAYTVKVTTKQEGPPVPGIPANESMTIDAKWAGACKPDQKPGDMIMAGRKTNVRDLQTVPGRPSPAPKR
jgi:hypothetical protein